MRVDAQTLKPQTLNPKPSPEVHSAELQVSSLELRANSILGFRV